MFTNPWSRLAFPVLISLTLSGCLDAESYEIHCIHDPGTNTWTYRASYWNLGSNEDTPEERAEDFEGLMTIWKGDEFVADTTDGRIVERSVWVEGDRVHGRLVRLTPTLPEEFALSADSMNLEFGIADTSEILETNGTLVTGRESSIRWPAGAREIRVKMKGADSLPAFTKDQLARIVKEGGRKPER